MSEAFFNSPILNSPYAEPERHWELDEQGQPTAVIVPRRRQSALVSPIPKAKKVRGKAVQADFLADETGQEYNPVEVINGIRSAVESWRRLPESQWQVTPTTARLLRHWRTHDFANQRPFFCQVEAVETVIWMTEVAPRSSAQGRRFWAHLEAANAASNPDLMRLALKLATGAGKTTVMAMLIAWQTLNAVRHPNAKRFSKGFLVVAPGITIKDRLRVLQPNDPESYYQSREIVPEDMLMDLGRAKIVITNYHAFKKKDEVPLNKVQQAALTAAIAAGLGDNLDPKFLIEEWTELVDAWGLRDGENYATVPRIGRRTRLGPRQRENAWTAFAFVREWLAERSLVTLADLYGALTKWVDDGGEVPFSHIVIDEAQDLSVAQAKFLAAVGRAGRPDALLFTGDLGQRIFHLPFSWTRLGLDVRGRAQILKVCYRTSHQIRRAADHLLVAEIVDQDGIEESRRGTVSVFDGPEPIGTLVASEDEEVDAVARWLRNLVDAGVPEQQIAILVRGEVQIARANAAAHRAGIDPAILTMHDAKGLEFRAVSAMALDEDVLPDAARLAGVGDINDLEAIQDTERHLLYVAATRARDHLLLSGVNPGSEFLEDLRTLPR